MFDLSERLPTAEEIESAAEAATAIARAKDEAGALTILGDQEVRIAPALADLMIELFTHIAHGDMVTLVPTSAELTTQDAADLLNVSRPYLIGLLKTGEIPFHMIGSHRRIRFTDLMAYKATRDEVRQAGMKEIIRLGQEMDNS